jgi:hypothetical protein
MIVPVTKDIIVRGYEFVLSYMPGSTPSVLGSIPYVGKYIPGGSPSFAEILGWCNYTNADGADDFGAASFPDLGVVPSTHGGAGPGFLFSQILKTWVGNDGSGAGQNVPICMDGLKISLAAGTQLTFFMGHMGYPGDAEMQGVIYYD